MSLLIRFFIIRKFLLAIHAGPFHYTIAIAVKAFAGVFFDVDEEADFASIFSAASIAIAVGAHVINHGVNRGAVHTESKSLKLILVPVLFVNGNDIVLTHPFFGHLTFNASKIAGPGAAVVFDAFFATRFRPGGIPGKIRLMPDRVSSRFA